MKKLTLVIVGSIVTGVAILVGKRFFSPTAIATRKHGNYVKGVIGKCSDLLGEKEIMFELWKADGRGAIVLATKTVEVAEQNVPLDKIIDMGNNVKIGTVSSDSVFKYYTKMKGSFSLTFALNEHMKNLEAMIANLTAIGFVKTEIEPI